MNTKIIVALVIGMALFGLTGAATATNNIEQETTSLGLMVGNDNILSQWSWQEAAIWGDSEDNLINQNLIQFALGIGDGNTLTQEAAQYADIVNAQENNIDQQILQAGIAFGVGNSGTQKAMQDAWIESSDEQFINQTIDQFQLAFALDEDEVCDCLGLSVPPDVCEPCDILEEGCYNGATQDDTQIAIIVGGDPCEGTA